MKRLPFLTLLLGALALLVHGSPSLAAALQFDRAAFGRGEFWRLFTGHFTHFNADHLRWDAIALLAFGSLVELRSRRAWLACVGVGAIGITLGVGIFQPQFTHYRGLSGVDSALFAFVATDLLADGWRKRERLSLLFGGLTLAGFAAKSIHELTSGLALFVAPSDAFQPVPLAHVIGAAVGGFVAFASAKSKSAEDAELTTAASTG